MKIVSIRRYSSADMMPSASIFLATPMVVWYSFSFLNSSLLIAVSSKPALDITRTATVFLVLAAVSLKRFPTAYTFICGKRLFADFVSVAVPPLHSAHIGAELLFSCSRRLRDRLSAAFAVSRNIRRTNPIPSVKRFYRIYGQTQLSRYFRVCCSVSAERYNFRFFLCSHH